MPEVPSTKLPESTIALLLNGYDYISRTCDSLKTDIFQTRLLMEKFYCIRGEDAAQLFYDNERFQRKGVMPKRVQNTLLGRKGVQSLDGNAHRWRKEMFMSLMSPKRIQDLTTLAEKHWRAYAKKWERMEKVTLFYEAEEIICRAVCDWSGVDLKESQVNKRTKDFSAMIDASGGAGPRFWRGRFGRVRTEKWMQELIKNTRKGSISPPAESALHQISNFHDINGELLPSHIAAVELMNIIRPTIAVARFITFAAVAIKEYPQTSKKLRKDDKYVEYFVQEVRRFYPFFPFIAARVRKEFKWNGYIFPRGRKVMLDLYGTDRDPKIWESPEHFMPERFKTWNKSAYNFIPQGGGNYSEHHRCPGEWITIELMKSAVRFLTRSLEYRVPPQNLNISHLRIPAIPKSRFVMSCVKLLD
ncbi:Cytochrome P450 [Chitinispirillum alkaliphilum]|nr:Cytochrome P450 [Chitinispirillum alkaliphilum]